MSTTLVIVNAGTSDPSSTRMLAGRTAERVAALSPGDVAIRTVDLRELASDVSTALVARHVSARLREAIDAVTAADAIVAATPVYAAGPSGLFTSFFQILDTDALIGTPVVLAATAGTARHALVADDQMRGMFGYLRTMTVPTALFAAPEDWRDSALASRIGRAALELLALVEVGVRATMRSGDATRYPHAFGSAGDPGIQLDSDLMRLARGGS